MAQSPSPSSRTERQQLPSPARGFAGSAGPPPHSWKEQESGPVKHHRGRSETLPATVWFCQLRGLCSEKRDGKAKVRMRASCLLAQRSLRPLPDRVTCQMILPCRWDCKTLCIQKPRSSGWDTAGWMEATFRGRPQAHRLCVSMGTGGEHPGAATAPQSNVSPPEQLLFHPGFHPGSLLPPNRLRLKANVFTTWLPGLEGVETMQFSASAWFCKGKSQQD